MDLSDILIEENRPLASSFSRSSSLNDNVNDDVDEYDNGYGRDGDDLSVSGDRLSMKERMDVEKEIDPFWS